MRAQKWLKIVIAWIRPVIVTLLLFVFVIGIIGFIIKWSILIWHPTLFFNDFFSMLDEVFSLLLLYEVLELLRTLSPTRLLDFLMTVLARKFLLVKDDSTMYALTIVFVSLMIVRLFWHHRLMKMHKQ